MELLLVIGFITLAIYQAYCNYPIECENKEIQLWVLVDKSGRILYTGSEDDVRTIRLNYKNKNELETVLLTGFRNV